MTRESAAAQLLSDLAFSSRTTTRTPPWPSIATHDFEVRNDVGYGGTRWITVGPADQPGTSIVQEPTEQPYGVLDCAVRDPAGNLIRIQELP